METITFYSYKGGVGRTLALANVAIYLSRFGQSVCLMDFDLEAPGLHYKFPQLLDTSDIEAGLVDYIYEFINGGTLPESLDRFSREVIPPSESQGGIRLIPAGNVLSPDYWQRLASINWHSLFYEENSEGVPFFLELKERISKDFNPGFLLIDSRTGITEMSGLCTSLLPDKVVFLIVNNWENIEGARQILRSIQKVERLPRQRPIDVTFAITRIPLLEGDKRGEMESEIVKPIQDFLNEPTRDLESQLNIQDICVLHSDRGLELSESLRLNQEEVVKETPLLRDYLRLFSKIIPDEVMSPKIDNIIDEIMATTNLLENPDKVQQELEGLVASYPSYPKSAEKLIDFYILRNAEKEKILDVFHNLWETCEIDDPKMLSKYASLFMDQDRYERIRPNFELEIIEKFISFNPPNKTEIELRLADSYSRAYGQSDMALHHYSQVIDEVENKEAILGKMLRIHIAAKHYDDSIKLLANYSDIVDGYESLRILKAEVLSQIGLVEEVRRLLDDGGVTQKALLAYKPRLYVNIMSMLEREDEVDELLNAMLDKAAKSSSQKELLDIGNIFYELGKDKANEFKTRIADYDLPPSYIRDITQLLESAARRSLY